MIGAVVAWSFLPVIFALGNLRELLSSVFFVAVANFAGAIFAGLMYFFLRRKLQDSLFERAREYVRGRPSRYALFLADGFFIAVSNVLFVWALSRDEKMLVTLVVESWPILSAFALAGLLGRFRGIRFTEVLIASIAVVGFYFLVGADNGFGFRDFDPVALTLALIAAITQAGTVVVHQKLLSDFRPEETSLARNMMLQTLRMVGASVFSLFMLGGAWIAGYRSPAPAVESDSLQILGLALTGGFLMVLSAILYARSLQTTDRPFKTLLWFLTPILSVVLLAILTEAELSRQIALGAALIIAANILLDKKSEPSIPLSALVVSATFFGLVVTNFDAFEVDSYFEHLQVLAAFYAILQGFLLNRLWSRRSERNRQSATHGNQPSSTTGSKLAPDGSPSSGPHVRRRTDEDINFSEPFLLSLLGLAIAVIAAVARPDTLLGAINAFLIPVTVCYLLALSWALTFDRLEVTANLTDSEMLDAVIGYISAVAVFGSFFAVIVFSYTSP